MDVSIHKAQEVTPAYKKKSKNAPRTYIPPSSVKKYPQVENTHSNSTSMNKSNSKEQISIVTSKNLLLEFDKTSTFYSKKIVKNKSEVKLEILQPKISPRKQPVVNKIRMFNTKFKSHIEPKKTTIALEDLARKDDKIKEICATLPHRHSIDKQVKSSKHPVKYKNRIQYIKGKNPSKSRNFKPFVYTEPTMKISKTTQDLTKKVYRPSEVPVLKVSNVSKHSEMTPSGEKYKKWKLVKHSATSNSEIMV